EPREIIVFRDSFVCGMRLPFHPILEEMFQLCDMCPGQLSPNSWRRVVWAFFACVQVDIEPSLNLFRSVMSLHHQRDLTNFVYLSFKRCEIPRFPTNIKGWKQKYFFLRPKGGAFPYKRLMHQFGLPPN